MTELEWVTLLDVEGAMGSVCNYDGNPMDTRIYIYIFLIASNVAVQLGSRAHDSLIDFQILYRLGCLQGCSYIIPKFDFHIKQPSHILQQ